MDIKTAQIKNTQVQEVNTSALRTPAKISGEGKSFIDEMISLPKVENKNPVKADVEVDKNIVADKKQDNKNFEFVSKTEKSFNNELNKESLSAEARLAKHKAAEKELVDEIVLMNEQQNLKTKNKNAELKSAEVFVEQKADSKIKNEENKFKNLPKEEKAVSNPILKEKNTPVNVEKNDVQDLSENSENIKLVQNFEKEIILPEKNAKEEIFEAPEPLLEFEKPEKLVKVDNSPVELLKPNEDKEEFSLKDKFEVVPEKVSIEEKIELKANLVEKVPVKTEKIEKHEKLQADVKPEKLVNEKSEVIENKLPKESLVEKEPVKFEKAIKDVKAVKADDKIKQEKTFVDNKKSAEPKLAELKQVEQPQIKQEAVQKSEIIDKTEAKAVKPENKVFDNVQPKQQIKAKQEEPVKVVENIIAEEPDVSEQINQVQKLQQIKSNPVEAEKLEKAENSMANDFVANTLGFNKKQANDKPLERKINLEPLNSQDNIGKVKDIKDDINVNPVDVKPVAVEDIKVIKMEVINPLADLNNSLNTTKTSDIVKFIDANLTTETAKATKTSSSKAAEAAKKASSEKALKMTEADAKFFNNLIETNQQVIEGTKTADATNNNLLQDVETAKSAQVSKALLNALKESQETNKSFRVDFDKDISVVLRVNKQGQISAEFIPGDEAVEQYLKANIPLLKQKFSDEGLEYDNLSYRQNRKENNEERQRQRGNKKENGYE